MTQLNTAITECEICGEPIKYLIYIIKERKSQKRRIPKAHNGSCTWLLKVRKARKKLNKYKKERENK